MSVIQFEPRRVDRIVLDTGIVRSADPDLHGRRTFWLEHIGADGGALIVWQGDSYAAARQAAVEWAACGLPICDRTGGMA